MSTSDEKLKNEYLRSQGLLAVYISPKERKIKKAIALRGKDHAYWNKMTSKQLGAMLKKLI